MYNEEDHIAGNIERIVSAMAALGASWEYIIVDDGSTDGSRQKAQEAVAQIPNCRVVGYPENRGRGFALRSGFTAARGEFVISTESDLSWGEEILSAIHQSLRQSKADVVVVSVYQPHGGMENVPLFRRLLSSWGNKFMRWCFGGNLTMLSGMTRGYRRRVLEALYLEEDDKEIHLEIIAKARALGFRLQEIPGTIRWPKKAPGKKPRSARGILRFVVPHLMTTVNFGSLKMMGWLTALFFLLGFGLAGFGVVNKLFLLTPKAMPNLVTYGLFFLFAAGVTSLFAMLSLQLSAMKRTLVHVQSQIKRLDMAGQLPAPSRSPQTDTWSAAEDGRTPLPRDPSSLPEQRPQ